ncbi:MAG: hypothetical protein CMJ18_27995 [Phycisphaeraceae bacterium]|nr:hypothetical protein [Phycisphaeraceae bacterium]
MTELAALSAVVFFAVVMIILVGMPFATAMAHRQERWYERVLVKQLLIDVSPRLAVILGVVLVLGVALMAGLLLEHWLWFVAGAVMASGVPWLLVRHLDARRRERLDRQIVDGITTLASSVRAGLNLVQSMEVLVANSMSPIRDEFAQLMREYQMGLDLNEAMRQAANRIGSSHYRLLFTALEMHRRRGGDVGDSLDRIGASIREIQRLEGKLDAVTASGRFEAISIACMPALLLGMAWMFDRVGVELMFRVPLGRALLLIAAVLIAAAFWWIRRIMDVDI